MNIIVTGGAGFIGSNFVFHMLKKVSGLPDYLPGQADLRGAICPHWHLLWTTQISAL